MMIDFEAMTLREVREWLKKQGYINAHSKKWKKEIYVSLAERIYREKCVLQEPDSDIPQKQTFEEFWDRAFGERYGMHKSCQTEVFYGIGKACWDAAGYEALKYRKAACKGCGKKLESLMGKIDEIKRGMEVLQ